MVSLANGVPVVSGFSGFADGLRTPLLGEALVDRMRLPLEVEGIARRLGELREGRGVRAGWFWEATGCLTRAAIYSCGRRAAARRFGLKESVSKESLYQRIGGKDALNATVDRFYERVVADERIKHFFSTVDMEGQRKKQKRFLAVVFGASKKWEGKDMRAAHAHLTLTEEHFTAVAENLQGALEDLKVPGELIAEVMAIAASTHDDVLGC